MEEKQLSLFDYDSNEAIEALWEPRDIWLNFSESMVPRFREDGRVEYKSVRRVHYSNLSEYYSMFSNTNSGGVLIFGVANNGTVEGCGNLSQNEINRIEGIHVQFCPLAAPEYKRVAVKNEQDFIIVCYIPCTGQLVENHKGEAFIRYGESKHRMTDEEKQDFRSTRHQRTYETELASMTWPDDFDPAAISAICDGFRSREGKEDWSDEEVLVDRLLMRKTRSGYEPTNALVLLASFSPRLAVPGARVKVQRFKGDQQGEGETFSPIRDTYIEGNLISILGKARSIIDPLNYDVTWLDKNGKFQTTQEYPFNAWYEALVNALVHRSYSYSGSEVAIRFFTDRLEIESPGAFMPPVNATNVFNQRASRNANICEALRYVGFTRMSREGTRRMRESMKQWNLPDPKFTQETVNGVTVKVVLKNDILSRERTSEIGVAKYCGVDEWKTLQEHEISIVAYAYKNGTIQVNEAANLTGRTWNTSKKDLRRLTDRGLLKFNEGRFPRDPKANYEIIEDRIPDAART